MFIEYSNLSFGEGNIMMNAEHDSRTVKIATVLELNIFSHFFTGLALWPQFQLMTVWLIMVYTLSLVCGRTLKRPPKNWGFFSELSGTFASSQLI